MDGRHVYASHVSWLLFKCDIPLSQQDKILHTCDMPLCVNPDHLWIGSIADNNNDRDKKGRHRYGRLPVLIGEDHHQARLTEADVLEIRTGALSNKEYARKFSISPRHVRQIKSGVRWKHLV
jgi:hypothetical protein